MSSWVSSSEQTQSTTFRSTDGSEPLYNGDQSYREYSDGVEYAYSSHYEQQMPYHLNSSSGTFSFGTTDSAFLTSNDPSPNLIFGVDSNGDSPTAMTSTNYPTSLSH
jgi:hypothetical protein